MRFPLVPVFLAALAPSITALPALAQNGSGRAEVMVCSTKRGKAFVPSVEIQVNGGRVLGGTTDEYVDGENGITKRLMFNRNAMISWVSQTYELPRSRIRYQDCRDIGDREERRCRVPGGC